MSTPLSLHAAFTSRLCPAKHISGKGSERPHHSNCTRPVFPAGDARDFNRAVAQIANNEALFEDSVNTQ
jgi:hypothetical protein